MMPTLRQLQVFFLEIPMEAFTLFPTAPYLVFTKPQRISTLPVNAHVKVKDPEFPKRLKARVDSGLERQFVPELDVRLQEFTNKGESISTQLQMGWSVLRSRSPYTNYGAGTSRIVIVKISNLDVEPLDATLEQHLLGLFKPDIIVLGQASYSADKVKVILKTIGPLESWQYDTRSSATQIKATAQFRSAEDARRAISKFNEAKLLILGNSKIFLSPLASVVFHVPFVIYDAIQEDLDILQHLQQKTRNVYMEVFPPGTPTQIAQNLMSLRIRGENTTAVAEAKGTLEKILAGDAAMDGDIKIWDVLFTNTRRRFLPQAISFTLECRRNRSGASQKPFGPEKVRLNFSRHSLPQIAIIKMNDREIAERLVQVEIPAEFITNFSLSNGDTKSTDSAVCWTKADDPYRTCGHVYSKACFAAQCFSAGSNGSLPLRCLGASVSCAHIFMLKEIESALPSSAFDKVLQSSFTTYIQTHPSNLQYCPTPDRPSIYRPTTTGTLFACTTCLTPICTTCHVSAHEGMTCTAYQTAIKQDIEALNEWKKEHNVKDCPKCKVSIEKRDGCNHTEHMQRVHGGEYDEGEETETDDEDE
ncbi:hypothetical protein OEA41_010643 [Lepraria neglecta]|uniref:RING-type domain-containing protein n=1 Tax=Lepraria neglecta TaxID=209136 RepID=A0AAE0DFB8_9LECA|nr:hypothetical protein OEA41_010643 [Lepraria neglecta]